AHPPLPPFPTRRSSDLPRTARRRRSHFWPEWRGRCLAGPNRPPPYRRSENRHLRTRKCSPSRVSHLRELLALSCSLPRQDFPGRSEEHTYELSHVSISY